MISTREREYLRTFVDIVVTSLRHDNLELTPGEIYDALAAELERRCLAVIERAKRLG